MFNVECIVKPSISNATLFVNTMKKALAFVKFEYMFLLYDCNNP